MEKLIILGTGNANAIHCYNTCFAICPNAELPAEKREYFLVDAGGGNGILIQLEKAGIRLGQIHKIFLSHEHTDHLLGMVWLFRLIAAEMLKGKYNGNMDFYCHSDLVDPLMTIIMLTVQKKFVKLIGDRIIVHPLEDRDEVDILGYNIRFFDILSTKAKQFGFGMTLKNGKKFVFTGDEPYQESEKEFAENADWMLHEAFCLYEEREKFDPYTKHHTTMLEACCTAKELGVKNLIIYHTEDSDLAHRKERYLNEGRKTFDGNLYVPDDLEEFVL